MPSSTKHSTASDQPFIGPSSRLIGRKIKPPEDLKQAIESIVSELELELLCLPDLPAAHPIWLWLLNPDLPAFSVHDPRVTRLWEQTPYWSFCWASGLCMAKLILQNPVLVSAKTVLDFGAGSGVVGIAAKLAGASRVIVCDLDPVSLLACKRNAQVNQVEIEFLADLSQLEHPVDLLLAADVLYDLSNRPLLDLFGRFALSSVVADSRVRDFKHPKFTHCGQLEGSTWPDLDESAEFREVNFYSSASVQTHWQMSLEHAQRSSLV